MAKYRFKSVIDDEATKRAKKMINYHQKHTGFTVLINVCVKIIYSEFIIPMEVKNGLTTIGSVFGNRYMTEAIYEEFLKKYTNKGPMKKSAVKVINELTEFCDEVSFTYSVPLSESKLDEVFFRNPEEQINGSDQNNNQ